MTLVQGELRLVTDTPAEVSQVWIQAPKERLHGTGMMTTGRASEQVKNGVVSFNALPGVAVMVLLVNGIPSLTKKLLVPDKANATLRECIEAVGLADDGTLSELEELALEVARIAAQIASADRLEAWAGETASAAAQAQLSNVEAGLASNHATAAASNARKSESNAKQSEINSKQSEIDARSAATQASTAASNVRGELQDIADDAASSADRAEVSQVAAFEHEVNSLAAAERAEFAAEETIQQVEGDFATRNYADSKDWHKRTLTSGEDLNTLTSPGAYTVTLAIASTIADLPTNRPGSLEVLDGSTTGVTQRYSEDYNSPLPKVWTRTGHSNGTTWRPWFLLTPSPTWVTQGASLSTILIPGDYTAPSAIVAGTIPDMPPEVAGQPFTLRVEGANTTLTSHRLNQTLTTLPYATGKPPREFKRSIHNSSVFVDWVETGAGAGAGGGEDSGTAIKIDMKRQASRLRRGGRVGTAGKTPVSLSFDHGFVNFRDKLLPHLIRLGLPCTVAVNPDTLNGSGESEGITFADLQQWSLNHGIEIAHHSRSHWDAPSLDTEGFEQAILSTIPEFKTNMPEVIADAYIMPGVSGTGYDGFNAGLPPENWYEHEAGRMILSNFPVVTAAMLGQATPALGEPTQTIDRAGVDITSWARVAENKISSLAGTHLGMAVFNHPSKIDNGISSARLVQFLEFLAAERDAGRVEVLTVSGFAYADATSNVRMNLAPSWESDQATITLPPMLEYIAGAQVLVETTATSSGELIMTATSDVGGLNALVTHTATTGQKYRLVFSIPRTAETITITAPGTDRSARIV